MGTDGKDGSDGENGKDGITPILGVDSEGYWTIDMGNGVQRLKDANGEDVKAIGQDGTDGKDGLTVVLSSTMSVMTIISCILHSPMEKRYPFPYPKVYLSR